MSYKSHDANDSTHGRQERARLFRGNILLVEDNADDVELTVRALKRNGFDNRVISLRDGAQALDYLKRQGSYSTTDDPAPALILLDLKLPLIDGLEVLEQIKSDPTLKILPVVMLTSSRQERDVSEAYKLGVNSYICKPSEYSEFLKVVNTLGKYWFATVEPPPENLTRRSGVQ